MPIIPALRKLRQEDCELKASLVYMTRPCLKRRRRKKKKQTKKTLKNSKEKCPQKSKNKRTS
jgi:hypothetical protein